MLSPKTILERTSMYPQSVMDEIAPMAWKWTVGDLSVTFAVWLAEVQDLSILGLDFLRFTRCIVDLG